MAKTNLKALRKVTQSGAPIERTVTWKVFATEENLEDLKELTSKSEMTVGDEVELEGQVFIKRLSFIAQQEVAKAFEWDSVTKDLVKGVFLIGVPEKNTDRLHLKAISEISKKLINDEFRTQLFLCTQGKEAFELLDAINAGIQGK